MGLRKGGAAMTAGACLWLAGATAMADGDSWIDGRIVTRIEAEEIYKSDKKSDLQRDVYPRVNSDLTLHLGGGFEIFNQLDFKPFERLQPGEKRYFSDLGGMVEKLGLRYRGDGWMVQAGKIHSTFGRAYTDAPGYFGDDWPKDYEVEHNFGAGFEAEVFSDTALLGNGVLSGSLFMIDRTKLDGTLIVDRHITKYEEGGPANTTLPQSVTLALEGGDGRLTPGFGYHLGLIHRAGGKGDQGTELGFALALWQKLELDDDWGFYMIGEVAHFHDYEATLDDRTYGTVGAQLSWKGFYASATAVGLEIDPKDGENEFNHLITFDLGHEWRIGASRVSVSAAWVKFEEDDVDNEGYGLRLRWRLPI